MPKIDQKHSTTEKRNVFSAMLDEAINNSDKQQNTIAGEIGYEANPNIMTMFKRGITRLPLDKIVPLARSVGGDPSTWLRMWFEAYMPDVSINDLEDYIGFKMSPAEKGWVKSLRRIYHGRVPSFKDNMLTPADTVKAV